MNDRLRSVTVYSGIATCPVCEASVGVRREVDHFTVQQRCSHFRYAAQYDHLYAIFAAPAAQAVAAAAGAGSASSATV